MKTYTEADLMAELKKEIEKAGSQSALATKWGVTRAYIGDLVKGRRSVGGTAERLGFVEIIPEPQPRKFKKKEKEK